MHINEFIADNLGKMANMSITKLKIILSRLQKSHKPEDRKLIPTVRAIIQKKKAEYPLLVAQLYRKNKATELSRRISK